MAGCYQIATRSASSQRHIDLRASYGADLLEAIYPQKKNMADTFLAEFTASPSDDRILIANHGQADGTIIHFKPVQLVTSCLTLLW